MSAFSMVTAYALSKIYNDAPVVDNINFSVTQGEFCGILGPNGAGKTTTLRMLSGHIPPTHGYLQVINYRIPGQEKQMRQQLGIVPQKDNLDPDFTVTENLTNYARYFGIDRLTTLQRVPQLLEFASLEKKAHALITTLSGGMQRRLSLARALINQPQLLVLDEPTTGLDPQARQLIWQRLRQLKSSGMTLILTTHYMEEAERLCDRLIIMDNGCILAEGTPRGLIQQYIEPQVVEIHGNNVEQWHQQQGKNLGLRFEHVGDTWFYYGHQVESVLKQLQQFPELYYLHRPANVEDVFVKLTGRELREN